MSIRVLIADPFPVVRAGLRRFFSEAGEEVVGEASAVKDALAKSLETRPDVVLIDVKFPDGSGFDVAEKLRARGFDGGLVFFASEADQTKLAKAIAVGADSYLLKKSSRAEIVRIARRIATSVDSRARSSIEAPERIEALGSLAGELRRATPHMRRRRRADPLDPLTEREAQILRCVALGLSNKEIAVALQLSLDTIKERAQNIFRKLDVGGRVQAAVWAVRNKLIP